MAHLITQVGLKNGKLETIMLLIGYHEPKRALKSCRLFLITLCACWRSRLPEV